VNKSLVIALLFIVAVSLTSFLVHALRPHEPVYRGKPLSQWLGDLRNGGMNENDRQAYLAVSQLGTNSIPALKKLLLPDSRLKQALIKLTSKQNVIRIDCVSADIRHRKAIRACAVLGPKAEGAIPELIAVLGNAEDSENHNRAMAALVKMGSTAIVPLTLALTNEVPQIRAYSAYSLHEILFGSADNTPVVAAADIRKLVPALMKACKDSDIGVRATASKALNDLAPGELAK
jgi:hypothetical protein